MVKHVKQVLFNTAPPQAPGFTFIGGDELSLTYTGFGLTTTVTTNKSRFRNCHDNVDVRIVDGITGAYINDAMWPVTARPNVRELPAELELTWPLVKACITDLCGV